MGYCPIFEDVFTGVSRSPNALQYPFAVKYKECIMDLLPFNSVEHCPCCGLWLVENERERVQMKCRTGSLERDSATGDFTSVQTYGDRYSPCLEKRCARCGYVWLEKTAKSLA